MSKRPVRSPSYPGMSLESAIQAVEKIESIYRTAPVDRGDAASRIGYTSLSGPANRALAALAAYGLLERAGKGDARVTERALAILHPNSPEERRKNLAEAAWTPKLFQDLRERFRGIPVPPEDGVITYLQRQQFNQNVVRRAAKAFLETMVYLEKEGVNDSHGQEPENGEESTDSGAGKVQIGDLVQWESQGALQFPRPRRVRAISDDGSWAFVEDSETGIPMNEIATVEKPETPASEPPTLPIPSETPAGETEWLRSRVGRGTSVRLLATGNVGSKEIERLMRVLQTQHDVLVEDEEDLQNDNDA